MVHDKTASDDEGSGDEAGGWGLLSSMAQSSKGKVAPEPEPQPRVKNEGSALAKAQAKLGTVTAQMRVALFSFRRALKCGGGRRGLVVDVRLAQRLALRDQEEL